MGFLHYWQEPLLICTAPPLWCDFKQMVLQEEGVWRTLTSGCLLPLGKSTFVSYRSQWPKEEKLSMSKISLTCKAARQSPPGQTANQCKVEVNNKVVEKENRRNSTDGSHHSLLRLSWVSAETARDTALILGEWEHSGPSFSRPRSVQMCWHCHWHRLWQEENYTRKKTLLSCSPEYFWETAT